MAVEQFSNNGATTLNGAINNSVTSITVTDGSKFPSSGNFRLICESEIMLCTARSGNTCTVTRGYESTTAASHADLTVIGMVLTNGSIRTLMSDYALVGTFASRPAAGYAGRVYHPTDTPWITKSVDDGSSWRNFYNGLEITPPSTSGWTWRNQGSAVRTDEKDSILIDSGDTGAFTNKRTLYRSLVASSNYTIIVGISQFVMPRFNDGQTGAQTVGLMQTSDFKTVIFGMSSPTNAAATGGVYNINGDDSFNSFSVGSANIVFPGSSVWFAKIVDDGTNRKWYLSLNGMDWALQGSTTRTNFLTPDAFMFSCHAYLSSIRLIHYKET